MQPETLTRGLDGLDGLDGLSVWGEVPTVVVGGHDVRLNGAEHETWVAAERREVGAVGRPGGCDMRTGRG